MKIDEMDFMIMMHNRAYNEPKLIFTTGDGAESSEELVHE